MPIRLVCVCGHEMAVPDDLAGARVTCAKCARALHIPTPEEDAALMRWYCTCGQRLKARARSAGKTVFCPNCKRRVRVPEQGGEIPKAREESTSSETGDEGEAFFELNVAPLAGGADTDADTSHLELTDETILDEDDDPRHIRDQSPTS